MTARGKGKTQLTHVSFGVISHLSGGFCLLILEGSGLRRLRAKGSMKKFTLRPRGPEDGRLGFETF